MAQGLCGWLWGRLVVSLAWALGALWGLDVLSLLASALMRSRTIACKPCDMYLQLQEW